MKVSIIKKPSDLVILFSLFPKLKKSKDAKTVIKRSIILNEFDVILPNIKVGSAKTMQILKMFVPIIFPTVISNSPFFAEETVIVSSGRDVPIAITVIVISFSDILKVCAKSVVISTTKSLAKTINKSETKASNRDVFLLYFGSSSSIFLNLFINFIKYIQKIKNKNSKIKASILERVPSKKRNEKTAVVTIKSGSSFFTVELFIFIGFIMLAIPMINNIFTIKLPITLETVISYWALLTLLKDIKSSGAHVQKDAIVSAIIILGTLKLLAIDEALSTKRLEK